MRVIATMKSVLAIDSLGLIYILAFAKGIKTFSKSNPFALWNVIMIIRWSFSSNFPYPLPMYCILIPWICKWSFIAPKSTRPHWFIVSFHSGFPAFRRVWLTNCMIRLAEGIKIAVVSPIFTAFVAWSIMYFTSFSSEGASQIQIWVSSFVISIFEVNIFILGKKRCTASTIDRESLCISPSS